MSAICNKVNYFNKPAISSLSDSQQVNLTELTYSSLPQHNSNQTVRIIAISDTHGDHNVLGRLPACDILIFCGNILNESKNITEQEAKQQLEAFNVWLGSQNATHRIVIGGNHDQKLEDLQSKIFMAGIQKILSTATYLCNTSINIMNMNIVGIPFSVKDSGNQGFQSREATKQTEDYLNYLLEKKTKVDILITHGPCENIGKMLKPKIAHFSGRAKNNYGISRVMHEELAIDNVNHRTRAGQKAPPKDLYCFNIVSTIHSVEYEPTNLPIVFDFARPGFTAAPASGSAKGNKKEKCIIL